MFGVVISDFTRDDGVHVILPDDLSPVLQFFPAPICPVVLIPIYLFQSSQHVRSDTSQSRSETDSLANSCLAPMTVCSELRPLFVPKHAQPQTESCLSIPKPAIFIGFAHDRFSLAAVDLSRICISAPSLPSFLAMVGKSQWQS